MRSIHKIICFFNGCKIKKIDVCKDDYLYQYTEVCDFCGTQTPYSCHDFTGKGNFGASENLMIRTLNELKKES